MIWRSGYPDVEVGGATLPAMVLQRTTGIAMIEGASGIGVDYAEFGHRIERISAWLAERGVGPGQAIAIWMPNTPPWAACALAAMRLGAAVTALNPGWTAREANQQIANAAATVVITTPALADEVDVEQVVVIGEHPSATSLREVLAYAGPAPAPATDEYAVALLPYSSGTTGLPKGVRLTHRNLVTMVRQVEAVARFTQDDIVLALAPFSHVLGAVITMAVPLAVGATVVTVPRFDPAQFLDTIERHGITATAIPPPVAQFLAAHPSVEGRDLSSLRLLAVGGAPLALGVQQRLAARLPECVVAQGWGLTETTASICVPDRERPSPLGTVGRLIPNTELRVHGADGRDLGPGEAGELWVRGPQIMAGYLHQPAATAEIVDADGWLHTGDLGCVDGDGNVVVVDRLKELIKVDGFQVAPAELEQLLLEHPAVADAAVVGRPDDRHGEVPTAYLVPAGALDVPSLRDWMGARTAKYKHISEFFIVDALPRTPSGKLLRRALHAINRRPLR